MSNIKSSSPLLVVGTRNWTMMNNSIKSIITENKNWIHLIINFYRNEEILPNIAVTTMPAKELFWELAVQEDKSTKPTDCILPHQWSKKDAEYWEKRKYSNGESVVLSLHSDPQESGKIKIVFEHKNTVSNVYKFPLCPVQQDAYLLFLAPLSKFRKMKNQCNPLSILTTAEFMKEFSARINQGNQHKKQSPKTNISCIAACGRKAQIVFIHCGHCVFCSKCIGSYKDKKCPICINPFVEDELISISKNTHQLTKCLVCPPKFNCCEMNSMMIPCGCIIGCHKYSQRAISQGDLCMNCNETVQNLVKVYVQE